MTFQTNIERTANYPKAGNHKTVGSYRTVGKESRVLAANSYELVIILFEELGDTLSMMVESARRNDQPRMFEYRAKALAILNGLDGSLDFDVAGDLAQTLHSIYVEAAKRIQSEQGESLIERVESAKEMLHEIEKSWKSIAPAS